MAGYTRQDLANNISNGNVIDADDLDNEFNAIDAAFNNSTGHVHDGTAENGAPITVLGPVQDIVATATLLRPKTTNVVSLGTDALRYKDLFLEGNADVDGTVNVQGATTLQDSLAVTSNVTVGGNLTVTGSATIAGNLTFGDAATDTVSFAADVNSNLLPAADDTYDLGAVGAEWRNLYIDGTANIDTAAVDTLNAATAVITSADINGGTIDNTAIGVTSASTGNFTNVDILGNATVTGTLGVTSTATLASVDINSGAIDGTVIGATSAAAGTFTNVDVSGDITVGGTINATVTGVSSEATKLATARTISLAGDVSGAADFDGSSNITITTVIADDSHNHTIANVDGLQAALDAKPDGLSDLGVTALSTELNYVDGVTSNIQTQLDTKLSSVDLSSYTGDVDITGELLVDSYNETFAAVTSSSNATTINCEAGNVFTHTLSENTTFTFSNPPSSGTAYGFSLKVTQDAGASGYTVTWPAAVDWPRGTTPTLTSTASAVDQFVFYTHDGGTTWYGFLAGQDLG